MVTTQNAVPDIFEPFGDNITHLPMIGNMTYDYFPDNYAFLQDIENRLVFEEFTEILDENSFELKINDENLTQFLNKIYLSDNEFIDKSSDKYEDSEIEIDNTEYDNNINHF